MSRDVSLLTFDCYGTLVDWDRGVIGAFGRHVCPDAYVGRLAEIAEHWEAVQRGLIQGPYRPYREILRDSVAATVKELDLAPPDDPGFLGDELGTFEPFADTTESLGRLAEIAPLWILSNIDNDILAATLERLRAPIARTITAQDLRSYKPARRHFEEAIARSGVPAHRILHVAFGFWYDIEPAKRLGFRTAWVNRAGDARPEGAVPDIEVPDLRSLVAALA
ncbi:MAG: haloacid dehalogenase [Acidobacteriota bacterium]